MKPGAISAKRGDVAVDLSHPWDDILKGVRGAGVSVARYFRDVTRARYEKAWSEWPVKTGRSRAQLRWSVGMDEDQVVSRVWHETTPETAYARFVYIRDRNAIRRIDRAAARFRRGGRKARRKHGARRYAFSELLVKPWNRDDEPAMWAYYQRRILDAVRG